MSQMTAPGARAEMFRDPRGRRRSSLASRLLAITPALAVMASLALAQTWTGSPAIPEDLKAAMAKADSGSPDALVKLADSGRADAQTYAGIMYLFGRGAVPKDPARGCGYVQKASATRADAMYLVGQCQRLGLAGAPDAEKAKAAFRRAAEMGYPKAKCELGQMLMAEPPQAQQGLALCKEAAKAGEVEAQRTVGDAYFQGRATAKDDAEARKWYEMAVQQNDAQAARKLGEMYAQGDGGKRDTKKAVELWRKAENAGDPLACILVADQLFSDLTGGRKPGPGTYAFKGGVPVGDIEAVEAWYQEALQRDPRPDVQQRAKYALSVLASFKTAAQSVTTKRR
jgi:TPR repeat protein